MSGGGRMLPGFVSDWISCIFSSISLSASIPQPSSCPSANILNEYPFCKHQHVQLSLSAVVWFVTGQGPRCLRDSRPTRIDTQLWGMYASRLSPRPKTNPSVDRFQSRTIDSQVKLYYLWLHIILEVTCQTRSGNETSMPVVVWRKNPSKKRWSTSLPWCC